MDTIQIHSYQSPCGELLLGSFEDRLCMCDWVNRKHRNVMDLRMLSWLQACYEPGFPEIISKAVNQLDEYFARERMVFDIPLLFVGTEFQKSVWMELLKIPYGKTISYAELATRIRNPRAVRAVAAANGANPISIFVPCHRVIGSNHQLVGYGGGLPVKTFLLNLESNILLP